MKILNFLRNQSTAAEIAQELSEIKNTNDKESDGLKELMQKWVGPALVIGVGLAMLQQLIGINTVIYYASAIFISIGLGISSARDSKCSC